MSWDYSFSDQAIKQLKKLGPEVSRRIYAYLDTNIVGIDDPRKLGKALRGEQGKLWRYRTGHYRIICHLVDAQVEVLIVRVGHRKNVYD